FNSSIVNRHLKLGGKREHFMLRRSFHDPAAHHCQWKFAAAFPGSARFQLPACKRFLGARKMQDACAPRRPLLLDQAGILIVVPALPPGGRQLRMPSSFRTKPLSKGSPEISGGLSSTSTPAPGR